MCRLGLVIELKKNKDNKRIVEEVISSAVVSNPQGFGLYIPEGNKVFKTMDDKHYLNVIHNLKNIDGISFHCRIATQGKVTESNIHFFSRPDCPYIFAQNGTYWNRGIWKESYTYHWDNWKKSESEQPYLVTTEITDSEEFFQSLSVEEMDNPNSDLCKPGFSGVGLLINPLTKSYRFFGTGTLYSLIYPKTNPSIMILASGKDILEGRNIVLRQELKVLGFEFTVGTKVVPGFINTGNTSIACIELRKVNNITFYKNRKWEVS